jgi:cobalt/nickel transport protein
MNKKVLVLLLMLFMFINILPLAVQKNASFEGADSKAKDVIKNLDSDYNPWFKSIWKPPSAEIESFLFAIQAATGAGVLGYYFGYKTAGSKYKDTKGIQEESG